MKKIAIIGAGGFGREVQFLIEDINKHENKYDFIGFFDDIEKGTIINNYPVLGNLDDLNLWNEPLNIVIAIGNPKRKEYVYGIIHNKCISFPILIHPNAIIGSMEFNSIGEGSIICASTIITVNIKIGCHVILNLCCTVGHDTILGDFSSFMPSVNISGEVIVERCVYVGTGAKIINQLTIGASSTIGAGAVVTKSIPANCVAVGMPAKPVKFTE